MGTDVQREREFKLIVTPDAVLPDLDGISGLRVQKIESRDLVATYWDTPQLSLARWGSTLRHRNDQGWCAKLDTGSAGAALAREEVVIAGADDVPPDEIAGVLRAFIRGRELQPIAELGASRDVFRITDAAGAPIGIITDDLVDATGVAVAMPQFREIEIELADEVDESVVEPLLAQLAEAGADGSDPRPKLLRALGLPSQPVAEVVIPTVSEYPTAREVIHAAIASSVARLIRHLPIAWLGEDPEGVHQARVAMRRLRSDLRTFGVLIDRRLASDLRSELSWLGSVLGAVRDADVLMINVATIGASSDDIDAESFAALEDELERHLGQCSNAMREAIMSERAGSLLDALVAASANPHTAPQADDPAQELMTASVRRRWLRMRRAGRGLSDTSADSDLHALRIQAKRVRYAAEAVEPAIGGNAARLAKAAAKVQSSLGELNDAVVATELLGRIAGSGGPAAFAAGQVSGLMIARGQEDRGRWERRWKKLDRRRNTEWLNQ